jgi:acetyltransferase-like isoleucine patch superfamily enzyme
VSRRPAALVRLVQDVARVLTGEVERFQPLQHALNLVSRAIPLQTGNRMRASTIRARGIEVGEGTVVYGAPEFSGGQSGFARMTIGKNCVIDIGCSFELGEAIAIGDNVTLGNNVMVITTTHELGPREHRAGAVVSNPVQIETGAWIGPRSVILPGVTIGAGAIVDAGSVVNKTVAPNTRVRGTPAKVVEELAP